MPHEFTVNSCIVKEIQRTIALVCLDMIIMSISPSSSKQSKKDNSLLASDKMLSISASIKSISYNGKETMGKYGKLWETMGKYVAAAVTRERENMGY
eukprot:10977391-Ditylum_brightwellii.AAC.1